MSRIVIFANGELADRSRLLSMIQPSDTIVCADGGTRLALALGLQPGLIIGDLDSMDADQRENILASGVPVERHPRDKDETDLELAVRYAVGRHPDSILIVAALGRRLDHTLGNIALLSAPGLAGVDVRLDDGREEVFFCRADARIEGQPGDLVSLIPWGGDVAGIRTGGLKWPLRSETLHADQTRGISNEMLETSATVTISNGLLLVVHGRQA